MELDMKWLCIMIVAFVGFASITTSIDERTKAIESESAMENGYEQFETDSGNLIWRKVKE